ncbi:MAG: PAS domain S-box protein [Burkholderiales bacterium]|nr:PAS domain S-box protein [Burkholderiales bacterium]
MDQTGPTLDDFDERSVYRSLFAANPDALLLVDARGVIVRANPAAARLLGYTTGELAGLPVDALVPDAVRPRHANYRAAYAHQPRARPMGTHTELVARRRDGSEVMVEIALSPLQDQGLPYVVAAVRDIADFPRVRQALQRARYNEFIVQVGRLAVDTREPHELLTRVPAVVAEALGVDAVAVFLLEPDRRSLRVASTFGVSEVDAASWRCTNRPETPIGWVVAQAAPLIVADFAHEHRFDAQDRLFGDGAGSALGVPLNDRGTIIGVLAARANRPRQFDEAEVRFMETLSVLLATSLQRVQAEAQLSHAQRLEAVGQLTGGIAHDFNNLLTVIQGNLQVLEEHASLGADPSAQQMVAAASRASRRGAELTGKLLAFSRRQVLSPSRVNVSVLLHSLADMLRRTLDQRVAIVVDAPDACPPCVADAGQLESALLNIAINSRDAMPDGGSISFACRACPELPLDVAEELGADAAAPNGFVAIDITDTGDGMSDEVRERAFEPFFTTKEIGRGTGLGLSTVYGFVKQSKGSIRLHSAPGAGTTVTMILPCPPRDAGARARDRSDASPVEAGLKVLLVEDEPEVRAVACRYLRSLGCEVVDFGTADQALASLALQSDFELLLTDVALGPGMRGTELARQVQARLPGVAVLLMSGYAAETIESTGALAWELLRKPFDRAQLARAVARTVGTPRP